jgi:hypothetical protein
LNQTVNSVGRQPYSLTILSVEAGFLTKNFAARDGRFVKSPPQFGQIPCRVFSTQSAQNVHSNEQIITSLEPGDKFFPQHSQNWRISNIFYSSFLIFGQTLFNRSFVILIKIGIIKRANF